MLQAVSLRDGWLSAGLAAEPSDRMAAEQAVARLYQLARQPQPSFGWVPSPAAALRIVRGSRERFPLIRLRAAETERGAWPVATRLASPLSSLRHRLDSRAHQDIGTSWLSPGVANALRYAPEDAVLSGIDPDDVLEVTVYRSLRGTLRDAIAVPLRAALARAEGGAGSTDGGAIGFAWYGQHDAYWVAHYDIRRRAGMGGYHPSDQRELDLWAALARSTSWWWPGEGLCVMAERPVAVHTEPLAGSHHGELRLHRDDGPAVAFGDGYGIHVLHGTPVPEWVLTGPTVDLIRRKPNVEVRRSAIDRIGWDTYIQQAALSLVATCPDPGNPRARLSLYDDVQGLRGRVLLVMNGTPEPGRTPPPLRDQRPCHLRRPSGGRGLDLRPHRRPVRPARPPHQSRAAATKPCIRQLRHS